VTLIGILGWTMAAYRTRYHASDARWARFALNDELKRPGIDIQSRSIHAIHQDHSLSALPD
jgi:hypothetical protein